MTDWENGCLAGCCATSILARLGTGYIPRWCAMASFLASANNLPRGLVAHVLTACPACLQVMRLAGLLIIPDAGAPPTQARRASRAWPARGCRPASTPPRKALSAIRRPRRAAAERITSHYAAHIC